MVSQNYIPKEYNPILSNEIKLEMAWIEITQKCNLRCVHCYEGNKHVSSDFTISLKDWKNVIDQLVKLGINRLIIIGGEPTCHSNIIEIIEYSSQYSIDITLFTNATCFNDKLFECIISSGISVKVSIYGHCAEIHDKITGVPGSFIKLYETLERLIKNDIKVSCAIIIMKENQNYLDDIIKYIKDIGLKYSGYDVIREVYGGTQNIHMPTNKQVIENKYFTKPNFKITKKKFYDNMKKNSCWYGKITIMENGNVIPCEFEREYIYGNVLNNTIYDIIHSDKVTSKWFLDFSNIDECKDCEFRFACKDCRPLGKAVCGNIYSKNPRCCYNVYQGEWEIPK